MTGFNKHKVLPDKEGGGGGGATSYFVRYTGVCKYERVTSFVSL